MVVVTLELTASKAFPPKSHHMKSFQSFF